MTILTIFGCSVKLKNPRKVRKFKDFYSESPDSLCPPFVDNMRLPHAPYAQTNPLPARAAVHNHLHTDTSGPLRGLRCRSLHRQCGQASFCVLFPGRRCHTPCAAGQCRLHQHGYLLCLSHIKAGIVDAVSHCIPASVMDCLFHDFNTVYLFCPFRHEQADGTDAAV